MARDLIALYQEQMSYGAEIVQLSELFFKQEIEYDEEAKAVLGGEQVPLVLKAFYEQVEQLATFDSDHIKAAIKNSAKRNGTKREKLIYADSCSGNRTNARSRTSGGDSFARKRNGNVPISKTHRLTFLCLYNKINNKISVSHIGESVDEEK
ncbi:Glutamate--tRNA ligase [Anoxybacillus sp. BCO1]|nr:Glutamate--tRNA ligase [Anoxybacillus sp. BCO1]